MLLWETFAGDSGGRSGTTPNTGRPKSSRGGVPLVFILHTEWPGSPPTDVTGWGGLTDGHKQIEREITKLKEDSARDVKRQLEQQQVAARRRTLEEVRLTLSDYGFAVFGRCSRCH